MLFSDHIQLYMEHWGNLRKFNNQSWETINSMVKIYLFRDTTEVGWVKEGRRSRVISRILVYDHRGVMHGLLLIQKNIHKDS